MENMEQGGRRSARDELKARVDEILTRMREAARRGLVDSSIVDDVVQESVLKGLQTLERGGEISRVEPYLSEAARRGASDQNKFAARSRKARSEYRRFRAVLEQSTSEPSAAIEISERNEALRQVVGGLPPFQCLVVVSYYGTNMSLAQIAKDLNISPSTVRYWHSEALKKLRAFADRFE
ncbi:MAG TPA: sigma-70 family RNA polymerase sigma factor [Phycisphaerales bacterium]|nr:sigma-70 family RNA polymerase sigma factor [Phycisphaerales bacterium]